MPTSIERTVAAIARAFASTFSSALGSSRASALVPARALAPAPAFALALAPALALALAFVLGTSSTAAAQSVGTSISTGREKGSYYYIGQRLGTTMLMKHGYRIAVETSSGSVQNLARLADPSSPTGLALTQSDALSRFLQGNREFENKLIVLGDAGRECVVLVGARRGGILRFADLAAAEGAEISVDDPGSGAAATFDFLVSMDPGLGSLRPVFVDTMEALLQLKVGGSHTDLVAAMWVQRPAMRSAPVKILLDNPSDYRLIPILPTEVENRKLPDDSVVYTFEKVRIGSDRTDAGLEVETICTRSLLLGSKDKLDREIRSKLSVTMLESGAEVIGGGH